MVKLYVHFGDGDGLEAQLYSSHCDEDSAHCTVRNSGSLGHAAECKQRKERVVFIIK